MTASRGAYRDVDPIEVVGIILGLVILAGGVVVPLSEAMALEIQRVLAIFLFTIVLWLTKPVPFEVSSLLSVTLLYTLGLTETFRDAVIGFASTLVFFLFLLFLLGASISKVGLDERAARRLLSSTSTPQRSVRSLAGTIFGLAFIMPSAVARAVTFIPVVRRIRDAYGLGPASNFERSSFFVLGHVNPIASMALMTGGGMAIITSEVIRSSVREITWVEWAVLMIPPTAALYALSAITAERFYPVDDEMQVGDNDANDELAESVDRDERAALTRDQRIVLWVMIGTVIAWVIGSFAGTPTILPAMMAVAILAAPGVRIITIEEIKDVSWGILFVIGAMFSILEVMEETGTLDAIIGAITSVVPFAAMNAWQTVAALLALAVLIRVWFSTASAAIIVTLPIVLQFGSVLGVTELYLALSILLIVGATTFLPFNTTSVLLSFDEGPLTTRDVFFFGLITMIYALLVIVFSWLLYWPFVTGI